MTMQKTTARVRLAQSRARALLTEHGLAAIPVDVNRLARLMGATVNEVEFPDKDRVSGAVMRTEQGPVILVNKKHKEVRRRFTIAHEVGHLALHNVEMHIDKARYRDEVAGQGVDPDEVEANAFAAELLMPAEALRGRLVGKEVMVVDEDLIDELAAEFKVSAQSMSWRLANLGFLR